MSIGEINKTGPMLEALRRRLAEGAGELRKSGKPHDASSVRQGERPPQRAEEIESIVRRRTAAFDRSSSEGKVQATRVFVESVLVAEFGERLLADPGFGTLVAEVSAVLRGDPQLRERLDGLLLGFLP